MTLCPGSTRRWATGTGSPICPACRTGYRTFGATRPKRRDGQYVGTVPAHPLPAERAIYKTP